MENTNTSEGGPLDLNKNVQDVESDIKKDSLVLEIKTKIGFIKDEELKNKLLGLLDKLCVMTDFLEQNNHIERISNEKVIIDGVPLTVFPDHDRGEISVDVYGYKNSIQFSFGKDLTIYSYLPEMSFDEIRQIEQDLETLIKELIVKKYGSQVEIVGPRDYGLVSVDDFAFSLIGFMHHTPNLDDLEYICNKLNINYVDFLRKNKEAIISRYWASKDEDIRNRLISKMEILLTGK